MKLDWKKTFLLGFGFLGISVMWVLYNTYVPIYLQAGHPEFDAQQAARTLGFGLGPALTGFIMTLDNIAAFFIQPLVGMWSDRTYTRIGRRMPYILVGAPIAVVAFALIPIAPMLIPEHLSGNLSQLAGPFALFIGAAGVMLLAMAAFRTPVIALMPDLTPSPLRSKANGVINLMGGVGGVLAFLAGLLGYLFLGHKLMIAMMCLTVVLAIEYFAQQVPFWLPLMTLILVIAFSTTHKETSRA